MAHPKKNRKERPSWAPYFVRKTKTLREKKESIERKHRKKLDFDN